MLVDKLTFIWFVQIICIKGKGPVVTHEVVVIIGQSKKHWVDQHRVFLGVKTSEHPAHSRDNDIILMENSPFLHKKDTVSDGCVYVGLFVVVQAYYIAFGDQVEQNRCQKCEETYKATESHLQYQAVHTHACFHEDIWHHTETEHTAGVGEKLHTEDSFSQTACVD